MRLFSRLLRPQPLPAAAFLATVASPLLPSFPSADESSDDPRYRRYLHDCASLVAVQQPSVPPSPLLLAAVSEHQPMVYNPDAPPYSPSQLSRRPAEYRRAHSAAKPLAMPAADAHGDTAIRALLAELAAVVSQHTDASPSDINSFMDSVASKVAPKLSFLDYHDTDPDALEDLLLSAVAAADLKVPSAIPIPRLTRNSTP